MWELVTGEEPYADLHYGAIIGNLAHIFDSICSIIFICRETWVLLTLSLYSMAGGIVRNTLRPPVPESCDPDWKSLMERCWSAEPSERPSFTEIANELRLMASKLPPKGQNQQPVSSKQPQVKS